MSKQVEVVIDTDGTVTIEVNGVSGPSCTEYTDALVRALDGDVISDTKKPEFYHKEKITQKVKN